MASKTEITIEDCMKGAMEALLRGDFKERDRLCDIALLGFNGKEKADINQSILKGNK